MTDSSGRPLRVAILGCGSVSADHLVGWSRCPGVKVVAACDPVRERVDRRAREFQIHAVYASPEAMFENEPLDIVDITSPRETHAANVRLAMKYKVHALCEKPLCPTLSEAEALVHEVGDSIRLMVNENWRYRAYYAKAREWIRSGRLGQITHVRIAFVRSSLIPNDEGVIDILERMPFTAAEPRLLTAEWLIHELDVARSLLGELRVVGSRMCRVSRDVVGEDSAAILLETPGGLPVVVEGVMSAAGYHVRSPDRVEIMGTRCSLLLENAVLRLFGAEQEQHTFNEDEVRQGGFDASIRHFVDGVRTGSPFLTSAMDQLRTLELVESAYALAGPLRHIDRQPWD